VEFGRYVGIITGACGSTSDGVGDNALRQRARCARRRCEADRLGRIQYDPVHVGSECERLWRTSFKKPPFTGGLFYLGRAPKHIDSAAQSVVAIRRDTSGYRDVNTTEETIMADTIKTESEFFAARIADGRQVHIYLINGIKLQARISAVDEHCILLQGGVDTRFENTSLIMKSAVSSVLPVPDSESKRTDARDLQGVLSINGKR